MKYHLFTSESVCEGHPDKICDQIADAILDKAYQVDPESRVAVEILATKNHTTIAGEVTCCEEIDYQKIARQKIRELDYTDSELGYSDISPIVVKIHNQSPDIALGVDKGGAGDQGMVFGYACRETPQFMPLPITLAHLLVEKIDKIRKSKLFYLRPDGKSEVVVVYQKGKPVKIEKVVLAAAHNPEIKKEKLKKDLYKEVVVPSLGEFGFKIKPKDLIINGTGRFLKGGPGSDTGETGRKIVVDSYGGMARVGGGCFSGKDLTKIDRSAAYAARFIAKNIVASKMADRCEVQLAYVIGYVQPIVKEINTFGTEKTSLEKIKKFAWSLIDLSVNGIVNSLKLRKPIYSKTARYGHFGNPDYPWEKLV